MAADCDVVSVFDDAGCRDDEEFVEFRVTVAGVLLAKPLYEGASRDEADESELLVPYGPAPFWYV